MPGVWGDNLPAPNNPNQPQPGNNDDCVTSTFSSCHEHCVQATPTPSCSTSCSRVIGCDTTGTTVASGVTPAPASGRDWTIEPEDAEDSRQELWDAAQAVLRHLLNLGLYDDDDINPPTTIRPTTTRPAPPTSTSTTPIGNPTPTGVLRIAYARVDDDMYFEGWRYLWLWYAQRVNAALGVCSPDASSTPSSGTDIQKPGYPASRSVTISGQSGCRYEGSDSGPGQLLCSGWSSPVKCEDDTGSISAPSICFEPDFSKTTTIIPRWIVVCQYGPNGNSRMEQLSPEELTRELPEEATLEDLLKVDESFTTMSLPLREGPSTSETPNPVAVRYR